MAKLIKGVNDLKTWCQKNGANNILSEWDYDKNIVDMSNVMPCSNDSRYWICPKGHSYSATPNNRTTLGRGCPYCSGRYAIKGENDLATLYPNLLTEWDYECNQVSPSEVKPCSNKTVAWRCYLGHTWSTQIALRTKGFGDCPYCSNRKLLTGFNDIATKYEHIMCDWDYDANIVSPTETLFTAKDKYKWKCHVCGNEWDATLEQMLTKKCDVCHPEQKLTQDQYIHDQFVEKLRVINPDIKLMESYTTKMSNEYGKILCKCMKCNNEWRVWPPSLLQGHGCPRCAARNNSERQLLSESSFLSKVSQCNPNIEVLGKYKGYHEHIMCKCKDCEYTWEPLASLLLRNHDIKYCPYCSKRVNNKDTSYFKKELFNIKPTIEVLGEYTGANNHIECKCSLCGYVWSPTASSLINGPSGCPRCSKTSTSVVEQAIYKAMSEYFEGIEVLSRDKSYVGSELDVLVKNAPTIAVEYGSWYWHKDKLKNDEEKAQVCKSRDIDLLRIYDAVDDVEQFNNSRSVLVYEKYMGDTNEHIIQVLHDTFEYFNLNFELIEVHIADILKYARNSSLRWNDKLFREKLCTLKPNISVLDEYVDSKTSIRFQCKICGHIWSKQSPLELLYDDRGCPSCAAKKRGLHKRLTNKDFIEKVCELNPDIEVLGHYTKNKDKILCKCNICGNEWHPVAGSLIHKNHSGCPNCGRENVRRAKYKAVINIDTGQFFQSLSEAALSCGLKDGYTISQVCKGRAKTAGGYHWKYADEEE